MQAGNLAYRETILSEYSKRRSRNGAYSLRAFARDLDVTYSRLNETINGKRGISSGLGLKIARGLGLNSKETDLFVTRIEASHGRSRLARKKAAERLQDLEQDGEAKALQLDVFELIAQWHHYAILELTAVEGFKSDIGWISSRLNIGRDEARLAIERLIRLGLLKNDRGQLVPTQEFTSSTSGIPSSGLKTHHEQILRMASDSIHLQDLETRDLSAITLAVRREDLPKAREMIKRFRRQFMREMESSPKKDSVYCLGIQLFRLDQTKKEKDS